MENRNLFLLRLVFKLMPTKWLPANPGIPVLGWGLAEASVWKLSQDNTDTCLPGIIPCVLGGSLVEVRYFRFISGWICDWSTFYSAYGRVYECTNVLWGCGQLANSIQDEVRDQRWCMWRLCCWLLLLLLHYMPNGKWNTTHWNVRMKTFRNALMTIYW